MLMVDTGEFIIDGMYEADLTFPCTQCADFRTRHCETFSMQEWCGLEKPQTYLEFVVLVRNLRVCGHYIVCFVWQRKGA